MSVKPIIFSGPMVSALLAGTKTQTRRLIKPRGTRPSLFNGTWADSYVLDPGNAEWRERDLPYAAGDLIYVRESCAMWTGDHKDVVYRADETEAGWKALLHDARGGYWKTAPSIHMPRWASRLTLEVSEVRVQRVQDISEEDVRAEGCEATVSDPTTGAVIDRWPCCRDGFAGLWNSLHGPDAWSENPWVGAYTFTVHHCNVDDLLRQRAA